MLYFQTHTHARTHTMLYGIYHHDGEKTNTMEKLLRQKSTLCCQRFKMKYQILLHASEIELSLTQSLSPVFFFDFSPSRSFLRSIVYIFSFFSLPFLKALGM